MGGWSKRVKILSTWFVNDPVLYIFQCVDSFSKFLLQKAIDNILKKVQREVSTIRDKLENGFSDQGISSGDTRFKVKELEEAIADLSEKVWELDKSCKNNLVFYGIKQEAGNDEHPSITEAKVQKFYTLQVKYHIMLRGI